MSKRDRVIDWAESLTEEELRHVCVNTICFLMDSEDVQFTPEDNAPYWVADGEDLV